MTIIVVPMGIELIYMVIEMKIKVILTVIVMKVKTFFHCKDDGDHRRFLPGISIDLVIRLARSSS